MGKLWLLAATGLRRELLRIHADELGFWVWECPDGSFKLISLSSRPDDLYAACAPVIQIKEDN